MYILPLLDCGCVAQLVEHLTFNQVALGSNPSALTIFLKGSLCFLFLFLIQIAHNVLLGIKSLTFVFYLVILLRE